MERWILKHCLEQLLQVYVLAEQQYVHATIGSFSPYLHVFYRQRAFERSDFVLQIQQEIDFLDTCCSARKTTDEFYIWHNCLYGSAPLNEWPITDIDSLVIDEKALEICTSLMSDTLPRELYQLIEHHTVRLESSLLSIAYLNALYNNDKS